MARGILCILFSVTPLFALSGAWHRRFSGQARRKAGRRSFDFLLHGLLQFGTLPSQLSLQTTNQCFLIFFYLSQHPTIGQGPLFLLSTCPFLCRDCRLPSHASVRQISLE